MTEQDLTGKTVRIVGIDTGGGAGQPDFVAHICLDIEDGPRVFVQATDPAHTWEIKTDRRYEQGIHLGKNGPASAFCGAGGGDS